jgi:hypothetical protein
MCASGVDTTFELSDTPVGYVMNAIQPNALAVYAGHDLWSSQLHVAVFPTFRSSLVFMENTATMQVCTLSFAWLEPCSNNQFVLLLLLGHAVRLRHGHPADSTMSSRVLLATFSMCGAWRWSTTCVAVFSLCCSCCVRSTASLLLVGRLL